MNEPGVSAGRSNAEKRKFVPDATDGAGSIAVQQVEQQLMIKGPSVARNYSDNFELVCDSF